MERFTAVADEHSMVLGELLRPIDTTASANRCGISTHGALVLPELASRQRSCRPARVQGSGESLRPF
jgi:hypothetical protein